MAKAGGQIPESERSYMNGSKSVTELLADVRQGRAGAVDDLVALVYPQFRVLAAAHLRHERPDHTLQPTALVHEAFLKLVDDAGQGWENRAHFFGVAANVMRRILVDHARRHNAQKRGGGEVLRLETGMDVAVDSADQMMRIDDALTRLAELDPRQARVVELRFFAGLTVDECAEVLGVAPVTIKRDWAMARAWLYRELSPS